MPTPEGTKKRFTTKTAIKLAVSLAILFGVLPTVIYLVLPHYHDWRMERRIEQLRYAPTHGAIKHIVWDAHSYRGTEAGRQRVQHYLKTHQAELTTRYWVYCDLEHLRRRRTAGEMAYDRHIIRDCLIRMADLPEDDPVLLQTKTLLRELADEKAQDCIRQLEKIPNEELFKELEALLHQGLVTAATADDIRGALGRYAVNCVQRLMDSPLRNAKWPATLQTFFDHPAITGTLKERVRSELRRHDTEALKLLLAMDPKKIQSDRVKAIMRILARDLVDRDLGEKAFVLLAPQAHQTRAVVGYPAGIGFRFRDWYRYWWRPSTVLLNWPGMIALEASADQPQDGKWVQVHPPTTMGLEIVRVPNPRTSPGPARITLRLNLALVYKSRWEKGEPVVRYQTHIERDITLQVVDKADLKLDIEKATPDWFPFKIDPDGQGVVVGALAAGRVQLTAHSPELYKARIREHPDWDFDFAECGFGSDSFTRWLLTKLSPGTHRLTLDVETDWDAVYSTPGLDKVHGLNNSQQFTIRVTDDLLKRSGWHPQRSR